jgi:hypothetical protein
LVITGNTVSFNYGLTVLVQLRTHVLLIRFGPIHPLKMSFVGEGPNILVPAGGNKLCCDDALFMTTSTRDGATGQDWRD